MTNQKINWSQIFALGIPYLVEAIKEFRENRNAKKGIGKYNLNLTDRQVYFLQVDYLDKNPMRLDLEEKDRLEYYQLVRKIDTIRNV